MDWPFLRHDGLLHEITEGRMKGKPFAWCLTAISAQTGYIVP